MLAFLSGLADNLSVEIDFSEDFLEWFEKQSAKIRSQIAERFLRIKSDRHFGIYKKLSPFLWELKFNNGNRIYYTLIFVKNEVMVVILGGNKNGQSKDIKKAQGVAENIHANKS
jgi:putative addiction module killer protein